MIYPIYVYGMPVLRKVAVEIDEDYEGLSDLIEDMYATMYQADGIGLAAPQVGKPIRLIVIDGTQVEEDDEERFELHDFKKVLIKCLPRQRINLSNCFYQYHYFLQQLHRFQ